MAADAINCTTCKYFRSPPASDKGLKVPTDYGDCRVAAPLQVEVLSGTCIPATAWGFPIIKGTEWCGQWVKK